VREHIAICEICGGRSRTLQTPYQIIASLGNEPVPYVPDLRDSVQSRLAHSRTTRRIYRMAGALTHGGGLAALIVVGAIALVGFLLIGIISTSAENLSSSTNQLTNVPAAAAQGVLLAETDKLVTVTAANGVQWKVAEVIAVNERNGSVLRSLPSSNGPLHPSTPNQLPVATGTSPNGQSVYEVTSPNAHHQQALVAFNSSHGTVLFATLLTLPGNVALTANDSADTLAVAPDGSVVYVGLGLAQPTSPGGVRVLVYSATNGALVRTLSPDFAASHIPMPPQAGSLPTSAFPYITPYTPDLSGYDVTLGSGGKLVVSADGQWLFDEELLSQNATFEYAIVRRFSTQTGGTAQELAIAGDFHISQLAVTGPGAAQQQLYLVQSGAESTGGAESTLYVLDPGASGPTQIGLINLGGLQTPPGTVFSGTVTLAPTDGTQLYATQNIYADSGAISDQDLWLLDTQSMTEEAQLMDTDAADSVLANPAGSYSGAPFILRSGQVFLAPYSLQGTVVPWLSLSDGHPIIALLAVAQ
ncbi:MAG: hypothetical protein ACLQUY_19080, partial [Ktedonobacterales bacterium]